MPSVRSLAIISLAVALAAVTHSLATSSGTSVQAGVDIIVDDDSPSCLGPAPDHVTLQAAVLAALAGDTIFVCDGIYTEPQIAISGGPLTIRGPGATPANDGVAIIQKAIATGSAMFNITADNVTIQGLDLDATLPGGGSSSATEGGGDNFIFSQNVVRNAGGSAMSVSGNPRPDNVNISRNHFYDDAHSALCSCTNSMFEDNIFDGVDAAMTGSGNQFVNNEMNGDAMIQFTGPIGLLDDNNFDGAGLPINLMRVAGEGVTVSNNQLRDTTGTALLITDDLTFGASSVVTVINNLFDQVDHGILIVEHDPNDGDHLTVDVGLVEQSANIFTNSGGSLDDGRLLLRLQSPADINAENNNWGYCLEDDIEQEISHQSDHAAFGFVDFVPFVEPAVCPTATPTVTPPAPTSTGKPTSSPTPSPTLAPGETPQPTPTPTPTPAATPVPTGTPQLTQGDNDCDGDTDSVDGLKGLQHVAAIDFSQETGCPALGSEVASQFGDVDCDDDVDAVDQLKILQFLAALPFTQNEPCTDIGEPF
jgi:hypothetical protein